ncbi:hypothetical protein JCM11641_007805 [Rhodosporidiobolus odoratus]
MSLPTVSDGANPFTVYLAYVDRAFYGHPASGLKVRLGVLFGLTGLVIVLAIVKWMWIVVEAKRHHRGSPWWLFRLADRQSGRFIVTNGKLVLSLFSVITAAVMVGQLVNLYKVFVQHKSQSRAAIVRAFTTLPLLLQGWLVPFASLQASLLASDHGDRTLVPAWLANTLFAGVGGILFLGVLATDIVNAQAGQALWNQAEKVLKQLRTDEMGWQPGQSSLAQLVALAPEVAELQRRVSYNTKVQLVCISFWTSIPVLVVFVTLASFRLARMIHHQVRFNIDQILGPLGPETSTSLGNNPLSPTSAAIVAQDTSDTLVNPPTPTAIAHSSLGKKREAVKQKLRIAHLSRGDLLKLANQRASAPDRERIRHIQALQKAEKDLVATSSVVLVAILAILGICIYFLVSIASERLSIDDWASFEATLTATIWIYSIALNLVFLSLVYFHWSARSIRPDVEANSLTIYGGQVTSKTQGERGEETSTGSQAGGGRRESVMIELQGRSYAGDTSGGGNSGTLGGSHGSRLKASKERRSGFMTGMAEGETEALHQGREEEWKRGEGKT